jgi:RNA-directed DNA polymerase
MTSPRAHRPHDDAYIDAVVSHLTAIGRADVAHEYAAYANRLLNADLPVIFSPDHFAHVVSVPWVDLVTILTNREAHYSTFRIAKRRGGSRVIEAPSTTLKHVQRYVRRYMTSRMPASDNAHGFRRGRSIKTNARPHVGAPLVVRYDITDFFGSVKEAHVRAQFRRAGYSKSVASLLTQVCTLRGALPQGAPTSPDLANLAAFRLDQRLQGLAEKRQLVYTRYADDLTFSGEGVRDAKTRRSIEYIIRDSGFAPNEKKTAYLSQGTQQRVTGLVVNQKLNWPRDTRRWLRQELYYLEKHGQDSHSARRGYTRARYREFIYGHVYALFAVRPDEASGYLERLDRVSWSYT